MHKTIDSDRVRIMKIGKRIGGRSGQVADILMFIFFIIFVVYFIVSYTSMQTFFKTQEIVDDIVRSEVEIVRTKGIFTSQEYENLIKKISRYGNFDVYITLEAQDNTGRYSKYFSTDYILDRPLKVGDFIKVLAESKNPPLFAQMLTRSFSFGFGSGEKTSFKMQSMCSGMICTNGYVSGLDVIETITRYTNTTFGVRVRTLQGGNHTYDGGDVYDTNTPVGSPNWIDLEGRYQKTIRPDPVTNKILGIEIDQMNN